MLVPNVDGPSRLLGLVHCVFRALFEHVSHVRGHCAPEVLAMGDAGTVTTLFMCVTSLVLQATAHDGLQQMAASLDALMDFVSAFTCASVTWRCNSGTRSASAGASCSQNDGCSVMNP